jgi:hypothetical protein
MSIKTVIDAHLRAAEAEGRTLTDSEVALIEQIVETPTETVEIDVVEASHRPIGRHIEAGDGITPSRTDRARLVEAISKRQAMTVEAAAARYQTHTSGVALLSNATRLADVLVQHGAARVGISRNIDVPRIASGDAAAWTTGNKAEIVTELGSIAAGLYAAFTEVETQFAGDMAGIDNILSTMLGRRVVGQENTGLGAMIESGAAAGTNNADALTAIANAIVKASDSGTNPNLLLLSPAAAAGSLSAAQAGPSADSRIWTSTLFGIDYVVVPGLTGVVALDAAAIAVASSPVLTLVDPYSSSKTNGVIVRVETMSAAIVVDSLAVAKTALTAATEAK